MEMSGISGILAEKFADWLGEMGDVIDVGSIGFTSRISFIAEGQSYQVDISVHGVELEIATAKPDTGVELWLDHVGDKKIQMIKTVRELTSLGLTEAKNLVDAVGNKPGSGKSQLVMLCQDSIEYEYAANKMRESGGTCSASRPSTAVDPFQRRVVEDRLHRFERELSDE